MSFSSRHLFLSIANLSCMEVNFLNQYPCMQPWLGLYKFGTLFSVALCELTRIFALRLSSSPMSSFSCLSFSFFCYDHSVPIFYSKTVLLHLLFVVISSLCYFGMFWFVCIFILSRNLFSLPSFARTFLFISSSCIFRFNCVAFLFHPNIYVTAFSFCRRFLICVFGQISHPRGDFCFCSFKEHRY